MHMKPFTLLILLTVSPQLTFAKEPVAVPVKHRAMLVEHCGKCHGAKLQKGKFRIDNLSFSIADNETAEYWQKVLDALNAGEMPPEDEKQLTPEAKADLLDDLANVMVDARRRLADQGGAITMRRLNRREYANSLRDLLGAKINVSELPADTSSTAFDTSSSSLIMSSDQFEQYLALGREALKEAFAREANRDAEYYKRFEAEEGTLERVRKGMHRRMEGHRQYNKWKNRIDELVRLPENTKAAARMRKLNEGRPKHAFYHWWKEMPGAPDPKEFGFTDGNHASHIGVGQWNAVPYMSWFLVQPENKTGAWLSIGDNAVNPWFTFWADRAPAGDYVIRIRIAAAKQVDSHRKFVEFGRRSQAFIHLSTHEVRGTLEKPQVIEIPTTITTGGDLNFFVRERGTFDSGQQSAYKHNLGKKENGLGPDFALWVDWAEIQKLPESSFVTPPGVVALKEVKIDLRGALQRFAIEACRGKSLPGAFLDRLVKIYETRRKVGDDHQAALIETVAVILASPRFLYLAEPGKGSLPHAELATRLSFFLRGAPPDPTLRKLAASGELAKSEVLATQTDRLLSEPEFLSGFVAPFTHQWLGMERLDFFKFNIRRYPDFDNSTKEAARQEVYESIAYVLRKNESLTNLLRADYVVVNSLLANYYGIGGVVGDEYRRVEIPRNSPRGGLLGMAAILAMGGNGEQSNPVERGAWVLRKLVNDPPPPAPANVPQINRLSDQLLTTRERLSLHQEQPQCASCHRKIDPIGFGLENFDAAGRWRTEDHYEYRGKRKTWKIDAAAAFHDGPKFSDYFELRDLIAEHEEAFATGFAEALVSYALGRPAGFSDRELIENMVKRAKQKNYAAREFVHTLIQSKPFQSK
ncbi:MAG: hypothetical protein CMJ78_13065 [Planctomycetaceae bacterium]|nr:hypothetical protein [Planctomycetaceae bacterium]